MASSSEPRDDARRVGDRVGRRVGVWAVAAAAIALLGAAGGPAARRTTPKPAPVTDPGAYQARLLSLVNDERVHHGLRRFTPIGCAADLASRWAEQIARDGALRHQPMKKLLQACQASRAAENIAMGNVPPERIVASWMQSRRHRENILDPRLTHVGLAAELSDRGRWYAVLDFIER